MIKSYAHYDENGNIKGYYDLELFQVIPEPNIGLTEEEWSDCINNQNLRKVNIDTKKIIEINVPKPVPVIIPDWNSLTNSLRGSAIFGKTFSMASVDTKINAAFTVLLSCVNSANPNLNDLQFSLTQLKALLGDVLTNEDIDDFNNLLINNYFPFTI